MTSHRNTADRIRGLAQISAPAPSSSISAPRISLDGESRVQRSRSVDRPANAPATPPIIAPTVPSPRPLGPLVISLPRQGARNPADDRSARAIVAAAAPNNNGDRDDDDCSDGPIMVATARLLSVVAPIVTSVVPALIVVAAVMSGGCGGNFFRALSKSPSRFKSYVGGPTGSRPYSSRRRIPLWRYLAEPCLNGAVVPRSDRSPFRLCA